MLTPQELTTLAIQFARLEANLGALILTLNKRHPGLLEETQDAFNQEWKNHQITHLASALHALRQDQNHLWLMDQIKKMADDQDSDKNT